MLQQYAQLTIPLIEEGQLQADLEAAFARLQAELVAFRQAYGDDARGAKASVTLKIVLVSSKEKGDDATFGIKSSLVTSSPQRPAAITIAQGDANPETGEAALFVRLTGSSQEPPAQGKLTTPDGKVAVIREPGAAGA